MLYVFADIFFNLEQKGMPVQGFLLKNSKKTRGKATCPWGKEASLKDDKYYWGDASLKETGEMQVLRNELVNLELYKMCKLHW